MTLYLGNDEVSQRINLASVKGTNLPEITEETSGMFLSNDGENIAWSEVETTVDTVLNGWSLFDYKFSDHILEDESWTRSDSFDWKDGTVYKSAYEHLLADYNNSEQKYDYRTSNINVIGELTNEKGVLSGFSASNYASFNTLTSFNNSVGSNPWEMVYKFNINELPSEGTSYAIIGGNSGTYIMDLRITASGNIGISLSSNGSSYDIFEGVSTVVINLNKDYWVKLQFTGTQYILSYSENGEEYTSDLTIESNAVLEPTDDLIYLGCRGNLGNPFIGSIDLNECYIKINGLEWWEGTDSIKYKLSADGHKICDYTQENAIQSVYELNGVAWYYIIDTINSKFKLPRSKWNFVGLRNELGAFVDESLPNITGGLENTSISGGSNTGGEWYALGFNQTGALRTESYISNECVAGTSWNNGENLKSITFDASLSSSAYQDNAPVQQRATEMYLYFYVGDVVRNTSIINVTQFGDRMIEVENAVANVESTVEQHFEEVNTTISEYKEEVNTAVANIETSVGDKLDTTQITNCITEIPQDIKLELIDGKLTLKAGSKVYYPNGFEEDGVTLKFDSYITENDILWSEDTGTFERTLYVNITSKNVGFITLSKETYSGETEPTVTYNTSWYDTTTNHIKWASAVESFNDEKILSFPIAVVQSTDTKYTSINQIFNGFGYIGSTVFVLPGVKCLIPNGRNSDGSLNNFNITLETVKQLTLPNTAKSILMKYNPNDLSAVIEYGQGFIEMDKETDGIEYAKSHSWMRVYCKNTNKVFVHTTEKLIQYYGIKFGQYEMDNDSKISSLTIKLPFRAVDHNEMETKANIDLSNILANIDYVVESKVATEEDPTWYRVYKSGWVEQGGISDTIPGAGNLTITLPKQMANNLYNVNTTNTNYQIPQPVGVVRETSNFRVDYAAAEYTGTILWEAKGQGA